MWLLYFFILFFIVYTFIDYRRSLFLWAVCCITMHSGLCLKYSSPAISVQLVINAFFFVYAYLYKRKIYLKSPNFILAPVLKLLLFSAVLSAVFGIIPFSRSMITIFGQFLNMFLIIYLLDKEIRNLSNLHLFMQYLVCSIAIGVFYGCITLSIGSNPIIQFEQSIIPSQMEGLIVDSYETYRGVKVQSFYAGATQFAAFSLLTAICYIAVFRNVKMKLTNIQILLLLSAMICAFLSKTRAGILASLISVMYLYTTIKSTMRIKIAFFVVVALILLYPFFSSHLAFLTSTFDSRAQEELGGSSVDMRIVQAQLTWEILKNYPLFGAGVGSLMIFLRKTYELYGAESVWFQKLIEQGLFGIYTYLYIFYFTIRRVSHPMKPYIIMAAIYWLSLHTMSTTGLSEYFYFLTFLIIYKIGNFIEYENRYHNISRL